MIIDNYKLRICHKLKLMDKMEFLVDNMCQISDNINKLMAYLGRLMDRLESTMDDYNVLEEEDANKPLPYKKNVLAKSNALIHAKYKATITELKINYLGSLLLQQGNYEKKSDGFYVEMSASFLKKELNKENSGSFYKLLAATADAMTGNNIGYMDEENEEFGFLTLVNKAVYKKGVFTIRYPLEVESILLNIEDKFTLLSDDIVMKYENNYSYRLYELLKEQAYYPSTYKGKKNYYFIINIGLAELKLDLGVVNTQLDSVKRILNGSKGTQKDFERAVEKSPEKMYNNWSDFKRRVIEPSVSEINEKSEMYVEYKPLKSGYGGKVYSIDFHVWLNGAEKNFKKNEPGSIPVEVNENGEIEVYLSEEERFVFILKVAELFKEYSIMYDGARSICEAAKYDMELIEKSLRLLKKNKSDIDNIVGWIISSLNWKESEVVKVPKEEKKNQFTDFHQRKYEEGELERILLNTTVE